MEVSDCRAKAPKSIPQTDITEMEQALGTDVLKP